MFNKKPKTIEMFVVTNNTPLEGNDIDLSSLKFFTITDKKEHCEEYINRRLFLEHKEHFVRWCELRELNYQETSSWELYIKSTGNIPFDKYIISKIKYKLEDVATIFRMFNGCVPIGTTYEDKIEVIQFMQNLPQESIDRIEQSLKESFKEKNS
jgi:hypothetical protein